MSERSDVAEAVLRSLRERPTLNTPSLIAMSAELPEGTEKADVEEALDALVEEGVVVHKTTGWKLAPGAS